jgi:hypothetical protein
MAIILMVIGDYSIGGYFINDYYDYSINGH